VKERKKERHHAEINNN